MTPAPESPDAALVEMQPLDTIRYWLDAYTSPASGQHFMGHGMVVAMLREYLALRQTSATTITRITAERDAALRDAERLREALEGMLMHVGKGREDGVEWVCEPIHSDEIKAARAALSAQERGA